MSEEHLPTPGSSADSGTRSGTGATDGAASAVTGRSESIAPDDAAPADLTWTRSGGKLRVYLGKREVLAADRRDLDEGQAVLLPDGRILTADVVQRGFLGSDVRIRVDDEPLPGSDTHALGRVRTAAFWIFLAALYLVVGGAVSLRLDVDFLVPSELASTALAGALLLALLGTLAARGSLAALAAATLFLASELVLRIGHPAFGMHLLGLLLRLTLLTTLVLGLQALYRLRSGGAEHDGRNSMSGIR